MFVRFGKAKMYVRPRSLVAYARWQLTLALPVGSSWRLVLRPFASPRPVLGQLPEELRDVEERLASLDVDLGWIRFPTDGLRFQVFDRRLRSVAQVEKRNSSWQATPRAVAGMERGGDLAPRVLAVTDDERICLESFVAGRSPLPERRILEEVLIGLQTRLYRVEDRRVQSVDDLPCASNLDSEERSLAGRLLPFLGDRLVLANVHGDLAPQNVVAPPDRGTVLLDWEYTRQAVLTYDAWFYWYIQQPRVTWTDSETEAFLSNFIESARRLEALPNRTAALARHCLHLLERRSFLRCYCAGTTAVPRQAMRAHLLAALRELEVSG